MGWEKGAAARVLAGNIKPPKPRLQESQEQTQITFKDLLYLPSTFEDMSRRLVDLEERISRLEGNT